MLNSKLVFLASADDTLTTAFIALLLIGILIFILLPAKPQKRLISGPFISSSNLIKIFGVNLFNTKNDLEAFRLFIYLIMDSYLLYYFYDRSDAFSYGWETLGVILGSFISLTLMADSWYFILYFLNKNGKTLVNPYNAVKTNYIFLSTIGFLLMYNGENINGLEILIIFVCYTLSVGIVFLPNRWSFYSPYIDNIKFNELKLPEIDFSNSKKKTIKIDDEKIKNKIELLKEFKQSGTLSEDQYKAEMRKLQDQFLNKSL